MSHTKRSMFRTAITLGIMGMSCSAAFAQRAPQTKEGASIVVDGIVREVFRSPRQTQVDFVIRSARRSRQDRGQLVHLERSRRQDRQEDAGEDQRAVRSSGSHPDDSSAGIPDSRVPEATRFWHLAFVIWHLAFVRRRSPGDAPTVGNSETRRRRGWRLR